MVNFSEQYITRDKSDKYIFHDFIKISLNIP